MQNILKTTNYNQFKSFPSNRPIYERALVNSIKEKNLLHANPIMVTSNLFIVDGQHRLAAAKILQVPIYYIIDENLSEEDIIRLNFNQKSWTTENFLNFYVEKKRPDYIFINQIMSQFKLPLHFVVSVATNNDKNIFKIFKNGGLIIEVPYLIEKKFERFNTAYRLINEIIEKKSGISVHAMRVLWNVLNSPNFDFEHFIKKCEKEKSKVREAFAFKNARDIIEKLGELINYRISKKNRRIIKS